MKKAESAKEVVALLTREYESLNIEGVLYYLTDDITWIGTAFHEHRFGKEAVRPLLEDDFLNDPVPYEVKFESLIETVVCPGVSTLFASMFFSKQGHMELSVSTRSTYVCCVTEDGYKICSWHCSVGYSMQNDDEYFPITFGNDILKRATMDALTGLTNRGSFEEAVKNYLESNTESFAFVLIDLDNFKYVNDRYGHQSGDEVLKFIAEQLCHSFDGSDLIGRLGGDEFVVLIPAVLKEDQVIQKMNLFIHNISQTIYLNSQQYIPSASVGIFFNKDGKPISYERCYQSADASMYKAKNSGKSTWNLN